jgi:hypothetical protein
LSGAVSVERGIERVCNGDAYRHQENATDDAEGDNNPTQTEQEQQLSLGLYIKSGFPDNLCALVWLMPF